MFASIFAAYFFSERAKTQDSCATVLLNRGISPCLSVCIIVVIIALEDVIVLKVQRLARLLGSYSDAKTLES